MSTLNSPIYNTPLLWRVFLFLMLLDNWLGGILETTLFTLPFLMFLCYVLPLTCFSLVFIVTFFTFKTMILFTDIFLVISSFFNYFTVFRLVITWLLNICIRVCIPWRVRLIFRCSSRLLRYVLKVEGLLFFLTTDGVSVVVVCLVSKEKENSGPMERDKSKAFPWLVKCWQKSLHFLDRQDFTLMSLIFRLTWSMIIFRFHGILDVLPL